MKNLNRIISFLVLIVIIVIILMMFYSVMIGFFVPVFLAAVLVVVFHPLHRWLLKKLNNRKKIAAAITTLLILLSVLIPLALVITVTSIQGLRIAKQLSPASIRVGVFKLRDSLGLKMQYEAELSAAEQAVNRVLDRSNEHNSIPGKDEAARLSGSAVNALEVLKNTVHAQEGSVHEASINKAIDTAKSLQTSDGEELEFERGAVQLVQNFEEAKNDVLGGYYLAFAKEMANPSGEQIKKLIDQLVNYIQPRVLSLTGATGSFFARTLFDGIILIIATFFFLCDGPVMINHLMRLSPLNDDYEQELLLEFDRISRAVVLATILSAIAQGLTAGLGYYIAGVPSFPLLTMLSIAFALIPFVGPAIIWAPVCLYLTFIEERTTAAILLALWGVLVVGTIDNLVKAVVLHGQSQLHPLLALLSVLGGVTTLGPVGIVVGPMVVAMLQTLLGILQRELVQFEEVRQGGEPTTRQRAAPAMSGATEQTMSSPEPHAEGDHDHSDPPPAQSSSSAKRRKRKN